MTALIRERQLFSDKQIDLRISAEIGQALVDRNHRVQTQYNALATDFDQASASMAELESLVDSYKVYIEDLRNRNTSLLELRQDTPESSEAGDPTDGTDGIVFPSLHLALHHHTTLISSPHQRFLY